MWLAVDQSGGPAASQAGGAGLDIVFLVTVGLIAVTVLVFLVRLRRERRQERRSHQPM
jgi:hypothetical protein